MRTRTLELAIVTVALVGVHCAHSTQAATPADLPAPRLEVTLRTPGGSRSTLSTSDANAKSKIAKYFSEGCAAEIADALGMANSRKDYRDLVRGFAAESGLKLRLRAVRAVAKPSEGKDVVNVYIDALDFNLSVVASAHLLECRDIRYAAPVSQSLVPAVKQGLEEIRKEHRKKAEDLKRIRPFAGNIVPAAMGSEEQEEATLAY